MKKYIVVTIMIIIATLFILMIESEAAVTLQEQIDNANSGDTITITQAYAENIIINQNINITSTDNFSITGNWTINNGATASLSGLTLNGTSVDYMINITGSGGSITLTDTMVNNISGNGISINDNALHTVLTITNSTITSGKVTGRGIAVRGASSTLAINNSTINTTGGSQDVGIHANVLSPTNSATISITGNSNINSVGYAFLLWEGTFSVNIVESSVEGYAALYLKPNAFNTIEINNSKITGVTRYTGETNNFGAIVIEGSNNKIMVKNNSIILNKYLNSATSMQYPILFSTAIQGYDNRIELENSTVKNTNNTIVKQLMKYNSLSNDIAVDTLTKFIDENDKPLPIIKDVNGKFINAFTQIEDAIAYANTNHAIIELMPGTYTRADGEKLIITKTIILATSDAVIDQAKNIFPDIALLDLSNTNLLIQANDISLVDGNISIQVGQTKQLSIVFSPVDVTDQTVNWNIDNENIATIDLNGVITGKTTGKAKLTVSSNHLTKTYDIVVNGSINEEEPLEPNPNTVDRILIYMMAFIISILGMLYIIYRIKRKN